MVKDDTKITKFVDSNYFKFSQEIVSLEVRNNLSQQDAAKICDLTLSDFLDYEMGKSRNNMGYKYILTTLQ